MSKFKLGDLVLVRDHTALYNGEWDGPFVGVISSDRSSTEGTFVVHEVSFAGMKSRVVIYDMEPFEISPKQNWILRHQNDDMDNVATVYFVDDTSVCLGSSKRDYELSLEEFKEGIQDDFDTVGYFWRYLPPVSFEVDKSYCWFDTSMDNYFTVIALSGSEVHYKYGNPLHRLYGKIITRRIEEIQNEVFEVEPLAQWEIDLMRGTND